ncbi:glycine zipper domain-containing protein [Polycladidibacter stylochi]|uniref:glycine zipper domain-containing protein n=1 Tax=Polycladidibacter stylochi TaxID=1807766 RepID=UPI000836239D|nr:glycine zipper domain-containing protein [Pseudovibrio stylochi]
MQKIIIVALFATAMAACSATSKQDRTLVGAGLGAATGAAIGAAAGGDAGSALAGAAIGGLAGGVVGRETTPKNCTAKDQHGRTYKVACP